MIKKYKEFINEGIFDLLSGYSMNEVKEKLTRLTPIERFRQLKNLKLTYDDVYTQDEIDNLTDIDKIFSSKKYDWIGDFIKDKARVKIKDKYGLIDINGKEITPIKYDFIGNFENNFAPVRLNNKYGLIDINGKEITQIKYDEIFKFYENRAVVKLNHKYGIIDDKGNELTPFKYDWVSIYINGKSKVKIGNVYGYLDKKGKEHWY